MLFYIGMRRCECIKSKDVILIIAGLGVGYLAYTEFVKAKPTPSARPPTRPPITSTSTKPPTPTKKYPYTLRVWVYDMTTSVPIPNADVEVYSKTYGYTLNRKTDGNGEVLFTDEFKKNEVLKITASASGYKPRSMTIKYSGHGDTAVFYLKRVGS